jgi:hypothetical protein
MSGFVGSIGMEGSVASQASARISACQGGIEAARDKRERKPRPAQLPAPKAGRRRRSELQAGLLGSPGRVRSQSEFLLRSVYVRAMFFPMRQAIEPDRTGAANTAEPALAPFYYSECNQLNPGGPSQGPRSVACRAAQEGGARSCAGENIFLVWIARKSLKSPESDEGIQENPRKSKLSFLGFPWSGLVGLGQNWPRGGILSVVTLPRRRSLSCPSSAPR